MRLCMRIVRSKCRGGVFDEPINPVEPPIEEPETPTTPPSTEDLLTIKINDEIMAVVGTNTWNAIAYGNGKYVAVGNGGYSTTSTDGINWTTPTEIIANDKSNWSDIVFANGKFFAVGYNAYVYASSDGISWIKMGYVDQYKWDYRCIAYGQGKFVVGGNSVLAYSEDCKTWTRCKSNKTMVWRSINFVNGKFIGVGDNVGLSDDGITWNVLTDSGHAGQSIAYGNGRYVLVYQEYCAVSKDGTNWSNFIELAATNSSYASVIFEKGLFIAIGNYGIVTSIDGETWSKAIQIEKEDGSGYYNNLRGIITMQ